MGAVVRRYMYIDILIIIITFSYSTCISSFFLFGRSIPTSLFIFKMFFVNICVGLSVCIHRCECVFMQIGEGKR